jgi:hypothetical protein
MCHSATTGFDSDSINHRTLNSHPIDRVPSNLHLSAAAAHILIGHRQRQNVSDGLVSEPLDVHQLWIAATQVFDDTAWVKSQICCATSASARLIDWSM